MQKYKVQFINHRKNARKRRIDFQFTYDEWVAWWGDDIDKRGGKIDSLVMARNGDVGPYHPDNVHKATRLANYYEARENNNWNPGTIPVKTKDGEFKSLTECAQFYKKHVSTIMRAIRNNSKKYGFIKE